MSFVVEVVKEAAKRRGMSYDNLLRYIKQERRQGTSAGEREQEDKEVNQHMEESEQEQTLQEETTPAEEFAVTVETAVTEEMPKTIGGVGNFGKPMPMYSQEGNLGDRLGRMANTHSSNHHYFQ